MKRDPKSFEDESREARIFAEILGEWLWLRRHKAIATVLGVWCASVLYWARTTQTAQTIHPLIVAVVSFGPAFVYWIVLAFITD